MKFSIAHRAVAVLLALLTLGGFACDKKAEPSAAPVTLPKSAVSVDGATEAAAPAPPAGSATTPATAPATVDDGNTVQAPGTLPAPEVFQRAIALYAKKNGRPPGSVDELVRAGLMNKLPTLDPSLKYKLDIQAGTIEIVNK